jgi:hypothetical protein
MRLDLSVRIFFIVSTLFLNLQVIVLSQTPASDARPGTGSISGRVTIGGQPAVGKKILVADVHTGWGTPDIGSSGGGTQGRKYFSAVTDAGGQYRLTGLPAGDYEVNANLLEVYVPSLPNGRRSRFITLGDGEEARNIDFTLARGGVITGRLTDADGGPIIGARVLAKPIDNGGDGSIEWWRLHNRHGETDHHGVYRIYGLPADRYRVSADGSDIGPGASRLTDRSRRYPIVYHPNVTDEKQALIVEVKEGSEVGGVNINLGRKRALYEVTGRIIDSDTGKPLSQSNARVTCNLVKAEDIIVIQVTATVDSQGSFRFAGLAPGLYRLELSSPYDEKEPYSGSEIFEVKQEKVSGLEIKTRKEIVINGVVAFENRSNLRLMDWLGDASISACVTPNDGPSGVYCSGGSAIGGDGHFRLSGLRPGIATLSTSAVNLKPLPYILRVEKDGVEIKNGIEVRPGEKVTGIRLVMTYGSGVIRGQLNVLGGKLLEGPPFNVITARHKSISGYYGHARVDGKGRFVIEGLMDGEYMVDAIVKLESGNGQLFSTSQSAQVMAGAETQVTLTLDPSRKNKETAR